MPFVERSAKLGERAVGPGARESHSTGFAAGTGDCGLLALNVFALFPRVGFGWPP